MIYRPSFNNELGSLEGLPNFQSRYNLSVLAQTSCFSDHKAQQDTSDVAPIQRASVCHNLQIITKSELLTQFQKGDYCHKISQRGHKIVWNSSCHFRHLTDFTSWNLKWVALLIAIALCDARSSWKTIDSGSGVLEHFGKGPKLLVPLCIANYLNNFDICSGKMKSKFLMSSMSRLESFRTMQRLNCVPTMRVGSCSGMVQG